MNAPATKHPYLAIGSPLSGGFVAGIIEIGGSHLALVLAPAANRRIEGPWNDSYALVEGALSYHDGLANTMAMAAAGSALAKQAMDKEIGGLRGWYIPSLDELELVYRNLKPTTEENWAAARAGINLHSMPQGEPYTPASPTQTIFEAFRAGGPEAIEPDWYWTSTQHAGSSDWAWQQYFANGCQLSDRKSHSLPALLVRRQLIG